ncbi:hypothetical protein QYP02_36145 [Pseudomonas aeruginosa]|nr:hypothetical protein [Pseudomonas aeruginosa]
MKITADQTRELLQLLVEVDGQSKAAAKQVFNGITPDGRLALLHDLRRRKLLAKPAPAQQLAKGEEEGEKVRAGKAKKVPYTLLMPPDQLEALRNLAEKDDTSEHEKISSSASVLNAISLIGKTVLVELVWEDDSETLWRCVRIAGVVLALEGVYEHPHFMVFSLFGSETYPSEMFWSDIRTLRVLKHRVD